MATKKTKKDDSAEAPEQGKEKKKGPKVIDVKPGDLEKLSKKLKKGKVNKSHDPNDEAILYEDAIGNKVEIISAEIKDEFCNYTYRIKEGSNIGDEHKVKGKGIIDPDMRDAFQRLRVHLANIDDAFILSETEVGDIQKLTDHELTQNYLVTGIKIKGGSDSELVSLIGNKFCTYASGRIHLETPLVAMDNLSGYKWNDDLRDVVNECRKEVAEYMNGKFTLPEVPEVKNPNQLTISDMIDEQEKNVNKENTPGENNSSDKPETPEQPLPANIDLDGAKV